jgi:hypothetical protein
VVVVDLDGMPMAQQDLVVQVVVDLTNKLVVVQVLLDKEIQAEQEKFLQVVEVVVLVHLVDMELAKMVAMVVQVLAHTVLC